MITLAREHAEAARIALIHRAADLRHLAIYYDGVPDGVRKEDASAMREIADECEAAAADIERQLRESSR